MRLFFLGRFRFGPREARDDRLKFGLLLRPNRPFLLLLLLREITQVPIEANDCFVNIGTVEINLANFVKGLSSVLTSLGFPAADWEVSGS